MIMFDRAILGSGFGGNLVGIYGLDEVIDNVGICFTHWKRQHTAIYISEKKYIGQYQLKKDVKDDIVILILIC